MPKTKHQPVLLEPVLQLLAPQAGESYLDLTAGYGGHARAIARLVGPAAEIMLVDQDADAVAHLRRSFGKRAEILHTDFEQAATELSTSGRQFDLVLMDIGVSSPQLEDVSRGFSFKAAGPLDMRMDKRQSQTAADIVNHWSEGELADLIYAYGEERQSRRIARAIVNARPITDTRHLAGTIASAYRGPRGRIHPATRTFQALRIAVNDELGRLKRTLPQVLDLLAPGGRLAVISFHSGEDRLVKQFIRQQSRGSDASLTSITKKPLSGREYDVNNPRARSAKLRAAIKNPAPFLDAS